jgi:hypothetical protein
MAQRRLPNPYIFELDQPLLLYHGHIIQPKLATRADDNFIELNHRRYALEEIATPGELEALYFRHNKEIIEHDKAEFSQHYFNQKYRSQENITERIRSNKVLQLIIEKVLPVLTAERLHNRIGELMAEDAPAVESSEIPEIDYEQVPESVVREVERLKDELLLQVDNEYSGYMLEGQQIASVTTLESRISSILAPTSPNHNMYPPQNENSALNELLNGNNLMLLNDNVYSLITIPEWLGMFYDSYTPRFQAIVDQINTRSPPEWIVQQLDIFRGEVDHAFHSRIVNKIESTKAKIDGRYVLPFLEHNFSDLKSRYKKLLQKKVKRDVIMHGGYQIRILHQIAQETARLEEMMASSSYERNGAGFTQHNGDYYVFIQTPAFAMRSPDFHEPANYLPFKPAKIGVRIRYNPSRYRDDGYAWGTSAREGDGHFEISSPVIMHSYKHPFLGSASAYKTICLGLYHMDGRTERGPIEGKVLALLDQAKQTIMMGYRTGSNPYIKLHQSKWTGWITQEEVIRRGLVCLNDWGR